MKTQRRNQTVFGIFKGKSVAESAVKNLIRNGFVEENISMVLPRGEGQKDFEVDVSRNRGFPPVIGGLFGALVGFALAVVIIYFFDYSQSMLSPIALTILAVVVGALFGAVSLSLVRVGTPDPLSRRYVNYLDDGGTLVSIRTYDTDQEKNAHRALEEAGGADVHSLSNEHKIWQTVFRKSENVAGLKRRSGRARFYKPSHS